MTPTTLAVEEALPHQPGLAVVHFRANGSDACDSVAAILAQLVQAFAGRLPLTETDDNSPGQGRRRRGSRDRRREQGPAAEPARRESVTAGGDISGAYPRGNPTNRNWTLARYGSRRAGRCSRSAHRRNRLHRLPANPADRIFDHSAAKRFALITDFASHDLRMLLPVPRLRSFRCARVARAAAGRLLDAQPPFAFLRKRGRIRDLRAPPGRHNDRGKSPDANFARAR